MADNPKLAQQCEETLASVLGLALHFLKTLRFNQKNSQQLYSVCLYAHLFELATACKALMEKNALVGIPALLRSMFEADIDLTNLLKCRDYPERMYAAFLKEKLRLTKEAASVKPNPFLSAVRKHRDSKKDLEDTQKELDSYIKNKKGPIDIRCRSEFAGMLDEYFTVYNTLCLDTHNNIRSLEEWHIEKVTPDEYKVVVFKTTKSDMIDYLSAIPGILLTQTKTLSEFLNTTGIEFDRYIQEIEQLRQAVIKSVEEP